MEQFITITGVNFYYEMKPFKIGGIVKLVKEPDNEYDKEAIQVVMPFIDKVGYVANSVKTVYAGTMSAGRIYDKIEDTAYAKIRFITHTAVIAEICQKKTENIEL